MFHETFHADRWAGAFFAVSGENADAVFLRLKALAPGIKSVRGAFFGYGAAAKLEKVLRGSSLQGSPLQGSALLGSEDSGGITDQSVEYAIRFICLMVEKKCIRRIDSLLAKIGEMLDERKGILNVGLESANLADSGLIEEMTRNIREKTGAAEIKIKTCVRPELLAGYVLRIGSFYVDASLKGQLEKLTADLRAAGI